MSATAIPSPFLQLVDRLIKREDTSMRGVVTRDPQDTGGTTKWGISQKAYPHLDIPSLTLDEAREIYYTDYLVKPRLVTLPPAVLEPVFDVAVNMGTSTAIKLLQQAVNVKQDGKLGPQTFKAVAQASPAQFRLLFTVARLLRYLDIILARPSQRKYAKGWFRRTLELY